MDYKVTGTELTGIADAIRSKGGTSAPLTFPSGFVSAISAISGGGASPVLSSITISSNGSYTPPTGVDGFDDVVVEVPTPSGSISINQNGTYDVSSFANAVVSVPQSGGGNYDNFLIAMGVSSGSIYDSEVSVVGSYAMYSNMALTGVEMTSCEFISPYAFANCSSLLEASFPACTSIGNGAFDNCKSLQTAIFPLCSYINHGFAYCLNLTKVEIPECQFIAEYAFTKCTSLSTLVLPKCSYIGAEAFSSCSALESLCILSNSVCATVSLTKVFFGTPILSSSILGYYGSVYVPESLVNDYKVHSRWSYISDRITAYIE